MLHPLARTLALLGAACAPLSAQADLRTPLQAWLARQDDPAQYEDWFVPFRKALLLAKSTKCASVPNGGTDAVLYDLLPAIQPLDDGMESFTAAAGTLPARGAAELLALAAAFRGNGDSLEPLLPWLLLVHKRGKPDACVELCLFEAWGAGALDCGASKAAAERLAKLDEAPLLEFLFEAKALPKDKPGTVQRLVNQLCAGRLDQGAPLGTGALARALAAEFEQEYEAAMQLADFPAAASGLQKVLLVDPKDWSAQLLLEACGGKVKGARFADRYQAASPAERAAIDARLQRLGLPIVAPGLSAAAAAQAAQDGALDFFRNDLEKSLKKLDAAVKASEKTHAAKLEAAKDLREEIVELERKIKKHGNIVGMRREVRDWKLKIDDKMAEAAKCDAEAAKELAAKTRLEAERQDLQGRIDSVEQRRSGFRLQPAPGEPEAQRAPAADQPLAPAPLQPDQPAAPVAPPLVEFDAASPRAQELREATAHLEQARIEQARSAFLALRDTLSRAGTDQTTQRLIAVTRSRLGETLQRLAMQKAREGRNAEALVLLGEADRELARVTGDDFGIAREGSSLRAAALRSRVQINTTLHCGYRDLAAADRNDATYRKKRDDHGKTANRLLGELKASFAAATLPDGRRVADVARQEAEAALKQ